MNFMNTNYDEFKTNGYTILHNALPEEKRAAFAPAWSHGITSKTILLRTVQKCRASLFHLWR